MSWRTPRDAATLRDRLEFPVIVKAVWGSGGHQVRFVATADEFLAAVRAVTTATADGAPQRCLVQEYIPGVGYGFTALAEEGEIVASFMHRRLAEHDVMRGAQLAHAATGAESVDEPELRASGTALLRALRWDGMAMVEFRRSDRDGHFYLMEVNPRFPGSLGLAIAAGVDFPALYLQRAAGHERDRSRALSPRTAISLDPVEGRRRSGRGSGGLLCAAPPVCCGAIRVATSRGADPRPHVVQAREAAWWLREHRRHRGAPVHGNGVADAGAHVQPSSRSAAGSHPRHGATDWRLAVPPPQLRADGFFHRRRGRNAKFHVPARRPPVGSGLGRDVPVRGSCSGSRCGWRARASKRRGQTISSPPACIRSCGTRVISAICCCGSGSRCSRAMFGFRRWRSSPSGCTSSRS
jgi:hypothetical protein